MSKTDKKQLLTPRGVTIYPHLNKPDTKWKADGEYHTKLALDADADDVKSFVAELTKLRDERYQEEYDKLVAAKKSALAAKLKKAEVATAEIDEETGEETGRLIIKVKMAYKVTSKKDGKTYFLKPKYFNGKREPLTNPGQIGGGSVVRCFVEPFAYLMEKEKEIGVSLRLSAIQIIKLVAFGQRSGDAYGFDVEDDADDIEDGADTAEDQTSDDERGDDEDDDL